MRRSSSARLLPVAIASLPLAGCGTDPASQDLCSRYTELRSAVADLRSAPPLDTTDAAQLQKQVDAMRLQASKAFLLGVVAIVCFGILPHPGPSFEVAGETVSVAFKAGMISAIALFGIALLTSTFISAHEEYIIATIGELVTSWPVIFALAVFLVAALTTSQSTATRTNVPIFLAAGPPPAS